MSSLHFSGNQNVVLSAEKITPPTPITFRIIPYHTYSGRVNMRLDNYFASYCADLADPVMRFYGWHPYCISLGYHQKREVLNLDRIYEDGYEVVRRPTGGRAIFHAKELTYSIIMPKSCMSHHQLYAFSHDIIARALNELGYPVSVARGLDPLPKIVQTAQDFPCFTRSAESEVQYKAKKVVGSAQKLFKTLSLQHGSILLGTDHARLTRYLQADDRQLRAIHAELQSKTISLSEIQKRDLNPEKIMTTVVKQLESVAAISVYFQDLTSQEIDESKNYEILL